MIYIWIKSNVSEESDWYVTIVYGSVITYCMVCTLHRPWVNTWKKVRSELHKDAACYFEQILETSTLQNSSCTGHLPPHLTNLPN